MSKCIRCGIFLLMVSAALLPVRAQAPESYRGLLTRQVRAGQLAPPAHLKDYVNDGKLTLGLRDAILLMLENNSQVHIQELPIEAQKFALLNAHAPFDPSLQTSLSVTRSSSPGFSQLQGVGISNTATQDSLTQSATIGYSEFFTTGGSITSTINSTKVATNNSFYFFNPYFSSTFNFTFTQPLLRNAGRFVNTAPLVIARRSLDQSRAGFQAEVNNAILLVVTEYWTAEQARGALDVDREALKSAEASYAFDQRKLQLGALPPGDIYQSQAGAAARRVAVIQDEFALKQAEEPLRLAIGADQDPYFHSLDLELTEKPTPEAKPESFDAAAVLAEALKRRPEIEAADDALANDQTNIRLAHNGLKPDLELSGNYWSSGLGGNQYNLLTGKLISPGGLGSSLSQVFAFGYPQYGGSLTLNLPLRNRAAQASLGEALVARRQGLYGVRQTREQITQDVTDALLQFDEAKLALDACKNSRDLAQKLLKAEQLKYELGTEDNFKTLDAQTKLAQAELALLQAQINLETARATIDHATGGLLDLYHIQISDLTQ